MSSFGIEKNRCAVCRRTSEHVFVRSTNAFGSSDLDTRPPAMMRDTLCFLVRECPRCGYVADNLQEKTSVKPRFLKSDVYRTCDGTLFQWKLASRFYRLYLIQCRDGQKRKAFFALLHAAWACDDAGDRENAIRCRRLALPLITELIEENPADREELILVKADVLRRAECFDELKEYLAETLPRDVLSERILSFQSHLADKRDAACYTVSDATCRAEAHQDE